MNLVSVSISQLRWGFTAEMKKHSVRHAGKTLSFEAVDPVDI